jgi:Cyclin, N-terminal domain
MLGLLVDLAELCEHVITSLFATQPPSSLAQSQYPFRKGFDTPPDSPQQHPAQSTAANKSREPPPLVEFVVSFMFLLFRLRENRADSVPQITQAYALYRTRLPVCIVHQSLLLLSRLKARYPSARGTSSSPHRLFLSSLMLSSKISMDDTYSNKSWTIVGGNFFPLKEVNQMERELFAFLGWNVVVAVEELARFVEQIEVDFARPRSSTSSSPLGCAVRSPSLSHRAPLSSLAGAKRRRNSSSGSTSRQHAAFSPSEQGADRHKRASDAAMALLRPMHISTPPVSPPSTAPSTAPSSTMPSANTSPTSPASQISTGPQTPESFSGLAAFHPVLQQQQHTNSKHVGRPISGFAPVPSQFAKEAAADTTNSLVRGPASIDAITQNGLDRHNHLPIQHTAC